jgi:multiple sugar transport system substrate-binding protein
MAAVGIAGRSITRRHLGAGLAVGAAGGAAAVLAACAWPAAAPGGGVAKSCTGPLELAIPWAETEPPNGGLRRVADAFGAAHPRCPVRLAAVSPWGVERLAVGIAAGAAPDLTLLPPAAVTTCGPLGLIEPVDAQFKAAGLSGADFFPPVWETMSFQGKVWHLPLQVDPNFPLFWNKATLRSAGLNPDAPPVTVGELDQMADQLSQDSGGQWERLGFIPWGWYGIANAFTTAAYMFGGSFYDRSRDRVTFNDPQVVRAAEWMTGWAQRLRMDTIPPEFAGTNPATLLAGGKLAFHPLVSIDLPLARRENPGLELGYGPLPAVAPGQPGPVWTGGWHVAVVAGSKRKDEAWELLRWLGASDEGTLAVARNLGGLPGYAKSPGLDELARDPNAAAHVEAVRRAKFLPPDFYLPVTIDYAPFVESLAGRRSVQSALDEMTGQTQRRLDQRGAPPGQGQGQGQQRR